MNRPETQSGLNADANANESAADYRDEVLHLSGLRGKNILVVGLGVTGLSVVRFLGWLGVNFEIADNHISDDRLQETLSGNADVADRQIHRNFSEELFKRFDVLMTSPGVPLAAPEFQVAKSSGVEILGDIALFARINKAKLIAVTGSNGKSTVVAWLAHVLEGSDLDSEMGGNIGKPVLDLLVEGSNQLDVVVLELSSFQLELVADLPCCSATVLNISEDHLDRYPGIEAYAAVKASIYNAATHWVINSADKASWPTQFQGDSPSALLVENTVAVFSPGTSAGADELPEWLDSGDARKVCVLTIDGEDWLSADGEALLAVSGIGLAGRHNIDNALAVIALSLPLGLPASVLCERLASFRGLPHRMQLVAESCGVRWFNDSKGTNVDACVKAITGISAPVVLIAGGLGKGADFSPLRAPVEDCVKAVLLFGEDAPQLQAILADLVPCHLASDMRDAVQQAREIAVPGDVVLLSPACASFDMFNSFEHRGDVFISEVRRLAA